MEKNDLSPKDKDFMLKCLSYEGWTSYPNLPQGWRIKRRMSSEGKPKGKFIMTPDGSSFDMIEDLDTCLFLNDFGLSSFIQDKIRRTFSDTPQNVPQMKKSN